MKRVLLMILLPALTLAADPDAQTAMKQAAQAYDAGRFAEAAAGYDALITAGWVSPELFFNAGNAAFRKADKGRAILHYRRAWSLRPRDAEINANLGYALQQAGANATLLTPWESAFSHLSLPEWAGLAAAGFWIASAGLALWLLRGRAIRWRRLAVGGLVAGLLGLAGTGFWLDWRFRPEWVVIQPGQQALFAPLQGATPHFALPPGSIVRLQERSGNWLRVRSGKDEGWIATDVCEPVLPWLRAVVR